MTIEELFIQLKCIDYVQDNRSNYERRVYAELNRFSGQVNYAYLYERSHTDGGLIPMQKYYLKSLLLNCMAGKIIAIISGWPRTATVADRHVRELQEFIHTNCGLHHNKDDLNELVTRWFQEQPIDHVKMARVNAFVIAFNAAFGVSLYYDEH